MMRSLLKGMIGLAIATIAIGLSHAALAHGMSDADKQAIVDGGNGIYLWLGATHMLTGYDHLLFVFGIIFFLRSFLDIAKYVTAFTLGHSVTLILATFSGLQLNYYLIDAVIGLSVCYIAFANLDGFRKILKVAPPNMMAMIIGLGLIHGLGLSTRLQQLPLSTDHLLLNIISFNVGIELGQIAALAAMLVLIAVWRDKPSFKPFSLIANFTLILAGGFLFLMQMHDFAHDQEVEHAANESVAALEQGSNKALAERKDSITIIVPAESGIEYKVTLIEGAQLTYAWAAEGAELFYDFHGEPKGAANDYFESFETGTRRTAGGSHTAPFTGTHGWYWENRSATPVEVRLEINGTYQLIEAK